MATRNNKQEPEFEAILLEPDPEVERAAGLLHIGLSALGLIRRWP